jgi:hypothetical protein
MCKIRSVTSCAMTMIAAALCNSAAAQEQPPNAPTREQLANDNKLFVTLAGSTLNGRSPLNRPGSSALSILLEPKASVLSSLPRPKATSS